MSFKQELTSRAYDAVSFKLASDFIDELDSSLNAFYKEGSHSVDLYPLEKPFTDICKQLLVMEFEKDPTKILNIEDGRFRLDTDTDGVSVCFKLTTRFVVRSD